jgi:hypothetical protein
MIKQTKIKVESCSQQNLDISSDLEFKIHLFIPKKNQVEAYDLISKIRIIFELDCVCFRFSAQIYFTMLLLKSMILDIVIFSNKR